MSVVFDFAFWPKSHFGARISNERLGIRTSKLSTPYLSSVPTNP